MKLKFKDDKDIELTSITSFTLDQDNVVLRVDFDDDNDYIYPLNEDNLGSIINLAIYFSEKNSNG